MGEHAAENLDQIWNMPGAPMLISGLTENSSTRFNGCVGQIVAGAEARQSGHVFIKLTAVHGGSVLRVPSTCVHKLPINTPVVWLRTGIAGFVVGQDDATLKYLVYLRDGTLQECPGTMLWVRSRLWDVRFDAPRSLQWNNEAKGTFIGSDGTLHEYHYSLPMGFQHPASDPGKSWPVFLYLHGNGGGKFNSWSERLLQSRGLQFVAQNFVLVEPVCEWEWTGHASSWVNELVKELRGCVWIDDRRVYISGCSMGGMSCWEIASGAPEMYAGIIPVAAHHKPICRDDISSQLANKPVFCWHARWDQTCPLKLEKPLWNQLQAKGNRRLKINVRRNADHYTIFKQAYMDSIDVYVWCLKHTLAE